MLYCVIGSRCNFIGQGIPLVTSSSNQTTIEGEVITFMCLFKRDYIPLKYYVQWTMKFQNGSTIELKEHSNNADYPIITKNYCPYSPSSCCHFSTELRITHPAIPLNNVMLKCTAVVNGTHLSTSSTSYLSEFSIL